MRVKVVRVAMIAGGLLLAGCLGTSSTIPTERFYRLAAPAAAAVPMATTGAPSIIALESVDARGVYVERALLYRSAAPGSPLQQYPFASWAEPPDVMLQDLLVGAMRNAFGPSQVLAPGQRGMPGVRLFMRLRALEQIRDGNSARARYAATFIAVDRNGTVQFVLDWDREAPAGGASPLEFVNALSGLVNDADRDVVERLRDAASKAVVPASERAP